MLSEENETKAFGFGIRFVGYYNGRLIHKAYYINKGVPSEVIILQLKSLLRNFEREYYSKEK